MEVSTKLVKRIGSLSLEDQSRSTAYLPQANINDGLFACFDASLPGGSSNFASSLIDAPRQRSLRGQREKRLMATGRYARTVIRLKEHERYWSVDENGVVTTEEFYEDTPTPRSKFWFWVELCIVVGVMVYIWSASEEPVLLESLLNHSLRSFQSSLQEYLQS